MADMYVILNPAGRTISEVVTARYHNQHYAEGALHFKHNKGCEVHYFHDDALARIDAAINTEIALNNSLRTGSTRILSTKKVA